MPSLVADPSSECSHEIAGAAGNDVFSGYDLGGRRTFARFGTTLTPSNDCSANNPGVDYCYDAVGRLLYETSYGRRLTFAYDAASNRTRVTHPDAVFFQYTYDALNRVDQIGEAGVFTGVNLIADYGYDPQSRRISVARGPNQPTTTYSYTQASRLAGLNHDLLSGPDANWAYAYTPAGQLASRTLLSAYEWTVPALSDGYSRNGLNQYTSVDGTAFAYDGRGNLTSDGARTLTYDLENRLTAVSGATNATLAYDPLGRLRSYTVNSTTTEFLYDGDRLIGEYVGGALQRRYVHGAGVDEPLTEYRRQIDGSTTRHALIADRQGSVVASIDSAGAATIHRYGPYGEPESWSGSRFMYTGQIALPELQLYHYKARVYDPVLGRFLQTDPVGYEDDLNLYAYVANDPINRRDPTGMRVPDEDREAARQNNAYISPLGNDRPRQRGTDSRLADWRGTQSGRASEVLSNMGAGRDVQAAATGAAMAAAGSSAANVGAVGRGMGAAGVTLSVGADATRAAAEIEVGENPIDAAGAATGRTLTRAAAVVGGARVGFAMGNASCGPHPCGTVGAIGGGLVGGWGAEALGVTEAGGELARRHSTHAFDWLYSQNLEFATGVPSDERGH